MNSYARTFAIAATLILIAPRGGFATEAGIPDSAFAAQVRGQVARSWGVDSAAVRLSWGYVPPAVAARPVTFSRLLGRGTDGWFAVVCETGPEKASQCLRLRAGVVDTVWLAARALATGEELTAADVKPTATVIWGPPAKTTGDAPGPGWVVRRPIAAGDRLGTPAVGRLPVLKAGDTVRLVWRRGDVHIEMTGTALCAATPGDLVKVRLAGRATPLSARALGPGLAVLDRGTD